MALVLCYQHKLVGDTSLFCFVDESGTHRSPKECRCLMVHDGDGWAKWTPTVDQKRRFANQAMPDSAFIEAMKKKFGRANPDCPILDAHGPIDPRGVLLAGVLSAVTKAKVAR